MLAEYKRSIFSVNNIDLLFTHYCDDDGPKLIYTDTLVKLFFGVVLERMLPLAITIYLSSATLEAVHDLENLRGID